MKTANDALPTKKGILTIRRFGFSSHQISIIQKLLNHPIGYMSHSWFQTPREMKNIMSQKVTVTNGIPLTEEQSRTLFLQLNYTRYQMNQIRRVILKKRNATKKELKQILSLYDQQMDIRGIIITANMGLVLAMVKNTHYIGVEITDLISEGSVALLRAADKFDCCRGFKFSTYACRAILRGFSRAAKKSYRYRSVFPLQLDTTLEKDDKLERMRDELQNEMIEEIRAIYRNNLAELSGTEQSVVAMRFSLNNRYAPPLTLQQVGKRLGLSKERIRQIQNKALTKLRVITEERLIQS